MKDGTYYGMDNIAFDEEDPNSAATAYLDMVNEGLDKASDPDGGKNPLMELTWKDELDPKVGELDDFFETFDMHTPLTDKEKEILERGVNDEAIDKLRELVKDAEVAGEVEQMEFLQKTLDSVEKCRAKGLLCGYIKIDKDSGEIVRGTTAPVNEPETSSDESSVENEENATSEVAEQPSSNDVQETNEILSETKDAPSGPQTEEVAPLDGGDGEQESMNGVSQDELNEETAKRLSCWYRY